MKLDADWEDTIVSLILNSETNAGISDKEIHAALAKTEDLCKAYKGQTTLPMRIANVLIDMQSSLIIYSDRHRQHLNNEEMAEKIFRAALDLASIARNMTSDQIERSSGVV